MVTQVVVVISDFVLLIGYPISEQCQERKVTQQLIGLEHEAVCWSLTKGEISIPVLDQVKIFIFIVIYSWK